MEKADISINFIHAHQRRFNSHTSIIPKTILSLNFLVHSSVQSNGSHTQNTYEHSSSLSVYRVKQRSPWVDLLHLYIHPKRELDVRQWNTATINVLPHTNQLSAGIHVSNNNNKLHQLCSCTVMYVSSFVPG